MGQQDLLITQKDSIFKILSSSGFNPTDFEWIKMDGLPTLRYKHKEYYIKFEVSENPFKRSCIHSPGKNALIENEVYKDFSAWVEYEDVFKQWLANLHNQLNANNFWDVIQNSENNLQSEGQIRDEQFSNYEMLLIKEKFETIKTEISSLDLTQTEIETINIKLDHLTELTESLSKIDWVNILIGSVFSLTMSLILTPETIKSIWDIIKGQFVNWFLLK